VGHEHRCVLGGIADRHRHPVGAFARWNEAAAAVNISLTTTTVAGTATAATYTSATEASEPFNRPFSEAFNTPTTADPDARQPSLCGSLGEMWWSRVWRPNVLHLRVPLRGVQ
jgi:hypothetical protein